MHYDEPAPDESMSITMDEHLLTLAEATAFVPGQNGKRPSISTLWRWCRRGLNGVRLEYVRCGRKILTSKEALSRFFRKLANADAALSSPNKVKKMANDTGRQGAVRAAEKFLEDEGI